MPTKPKKLNLSQEDLAVLKELFRQDVALAKQEWKHPTNGYLIMAYKDYVKVRDKGLSDRLYHGFTMNQLFDYYLERASKNLDQGYALVGVKVFREFSRRAYPF